VVFEKKNSKNIFSLDLLGILIVVIVFTAYITYGICKIYGVLDSGNTKDQVTVLEVVNGFAQIATALAFFLAVYQYRKNGEKERQLVIAEEAKSQIRKMVELSDELAKNKTCTNSELNRFLESMSNCAVDFSELYSAVTDSLHKSIVRMHWQAMHYNHLSKALKTLTVEKLFRNCSLNIDEGGYSLFDARFHSGVASKPQHLREYFFTKKIFDDLSICEEIVESFNGVAAFYNYFFDPKSINDLMYGLLSRIGIRVSAPLIAAIYEKRGSA